MYAFELWNPRSRVAHHLHAPAQFVRARRLSVPCVALIREPSQAVSSLVAFYEGALPVGLALRSYVSFHRALLKLADGVVCSFEELVEDPSIIVERAKRSSEAGSGPGRWMRPSKRNFGSRSSASTAVPGFPSRLTIPSDQKLADKLRIRRDVEGHRLLRQARAAHDMVLARAAKMPLRRPRTPPA